MINKFLKWINIKERIHKHDIHPPYFNEGEMWWAHVGENVGSEVNGNGERFTRPVIIYRKLSQYTFLAIPTSTKNKKGTWYVSFRQHGVDEIAVLAQVRVLSFKRLKEKIGTLDDSDMKNIREGFKALYC